MGFGASVQLPLLYSEMSLYARDHDLRETVEELDEFIALMLKMDDVYLKWLTERKSQQGA